MAKGDFYFPLYYHRLLTTTTGWSDEDFGAYLRLLIHQFDSGFVPKELKNIKKISKKAAKNWEFFSKKFKKNENGDFINEVMDEIRKEIQDKKSTNKLNGFLGGRPKSKNTHENKTERLSKEITDRGYIQYTEKRDKERENTDSLNFFSIEHCSIVAMNDERWVKANKATKEKLQEFNRELEKRGLYSKNPMDYKKHFASWWSQKKQEAEGPKQNSNNIYGL